MKFSGIFLFLIFQCFSITGQMITIDLSREFQTIEGFGGFGAEKAWWENAPYYDKEFLDLAIDSLGCSIFRTQLYWDFEPVNDNDDPFVLDESKLSFGPKTGNGKQFEYLKALNTRGAKIIVTVWSPPGWMKDMTDPSTIPSTCYNCLDLSWGCTREMCGGVLKQSYYEEFAEYLVAYLKTIKQQTDIDIYAISIQNEPLFANPFEAAVLRPQPYARVLDVVRKRFEKEGIKTLIFGPEHMGEYTWVPGNQEYVNQIFTKSSAGKDFLDIYAVHGYVDGVANDYGTAEGWTKLYNAATLQNKKPLWMTETGNEVANNFAAGFNFSKAVHLALKFGHISGWVFWAIDGNLIADKKLTQTGHAMQSFYKHIRPGFINVEANSTDSDVLVTAFKKDKSMVIVAINNSNFLKKVEINSAGESLPQSFDIYRYSATEPHLNMGIFTGKAVDLPPKSVSTFVYEDMGTSTQNIEKNTSLVKIFPTILNQKTIHFEASNPCKILQISICTVNGQVLKSIEVPSNWNNMLDVEELNAGIYLVRMETNLGIVTEKVIIK